MQTIRSPFLNEMELEQNTELENSYANAEFYVSQSPFTAENEFENGIQGEDELENDNRASAYYEMLEELHESEFETATENMVTELEQNLTSYEAGGSFMNKEQYEQLAYNYLEPVAQQATRLLESAAQEFEGMQTETMNEMELEAVMDKVYNARNNFGTPAQEFFLKKFVNKAKAVIKKGLKFAKKISPIHILLKKIIPFLKPLLIRILNKALNFVPASIRPAAKELAYKRLGKVPGAENDDNNEGDNNSDDSSSSTDGTESTSGSDATVDTGENIQTEFDHYVAGAITSNSELEFEQLMSEFENTVKNTEHTDIRELEDAREKFVQELESLKEGESPAAAFENFLPIVFKVAMKAAKIVVNKIGRPKVIEFISKHLKTLMMKFISEQNAGKLAVFMADKGLKLLNLESAEGSSNKAVFEALANTVEETAYKIGSFSEEVLANTELLASETNMAFENAAAAYFPDNSIKQELRESETGDGYWQNKGLYFKHTKVFDVELTPAQLSNVQTFQGVTISQFLKDAYSLAGNKTVSAKVHLYKIKKGATLSKIALNEKVQGLGNASRRAYNSIFPLTKQAASIILGQPNLGVDIRPIHNRTVHLIFPYERFYFLEITGTSIKPAISNDAQVATNNGYNYSGNSTPSVDITPNAKSSQMRFIISGDMNSGIVFKAKIFFSEKDAKAILEGLQKENFTELYKYITSLDFGGFKNFFKDKHKKNYGFFKIIFSTIANIVKENLSKSVIQHIKSCIGDFEKAVNDPADGVTIQIKFLFKIKYGLKVRKSIKEGLENSTISIKPGYVTSHINNYNTQVGQGINGFNDAFQKGMTQSGSLLKIRKPSFN
jgi:hypothetical protein